MTIAEGSEQKTPNENMKLNFFAHISRLYNNTVNAAITVVFGWLAFNTTLTD